MFFRKRHFFISAKINKYILFCSLSVIHSLSLRFSLGDAFRHFVFQIKSMANSSNRRRLSFVDFTHPQAWHKLIEYTDVTLTFAKLSTRRTSFLFSKILDWSLVTDFTNHWAKICFLASSQLHNLVTDFRKKTETEIREKFARASVCFPSSEFLLKVSSRWHDVWFMGVVTAGIGTGVTSNLSWRNLLKNYSNYRRWRKWLVWWKKKSAGH